MFVQRRNQTRGRGMAFSLAATITIAEESPLGLNQCLFALSICVCAINNGKTERKRHSPLFPTNVCKVFSIIFRLFPLMRWGLVGADNGQLSR